MDITSLPTEMFESVLKYAEITELIRLRTINKRVDLIVKKAKLNKRIPVQSLEIRPYSHGIYCVDFELESRILTTSEIPRSYSFPFFGKENIARELAGWFEKLTITSQFTLHNNIPFNSDLLHVMLNNKKSFENIRILSLPSPQISLTLEEMTEFIKMSRNLDKIFLRSDKPCDVLLNAQVLGGRKWESMELDVGNRRGQYMHNTLDDDFLLKVVSNCKYFVSYSSIHESRFTLWGVIDLWKKICSGGVDADSLDIGTVYLHAIPFRSVDLFVNPLPGVVKKERCDKWNQSFICYELHPGYNDTFKTLLSFSIPIPNDLRFCDT